MRATRRSDTIFVFGSGASLNELSPRELEEFEEHDTLGFNWFVRQRFLRCDYHVVREITDDDLDPRVWRPAVEEYFRLVRESPFFAATVFVVQSGFRAINGNRAIALKLLPPGARVFRFRSLVGRWDLSPSLGQGLAHRHATLEECVNFAYLLGWNRIVLVGVDLYDRRYFWLGPDETRETDRRRGASASDAHRTATTGLIEQMGDWGLRMQTSNVALEVYNPRSLLADVLPVYRRRV